MTNDELQTLRLLLREEVGTAVYASEQRLGERIDALKHRMDQLEAAQKEMQAAQKEMQAAQKEIQAAQKEIQADLLEIKANYVETKSTLIKVVSVLDEATAHIKEIRENQYMLERRFEERSGQLWHNLQALAETQKEFTKEFTSMIRMLNDRIFAHEKLPLDQAHRRPGSAA